MNRYTDGQSGESAYRARGIKPGTERTRELLDRLGKPDKSLKTVHIAGSNGKGSVAEFITEILVAAGKRVGTFTSPVVYSYNGQFRVDGVPMCDDKLGEYISAAENVSSGTGATRFEIETAAAFYAFYSQGCEYAVIECGMGGSFDSTNAAENKQIAVITSVSLEHTQYLGDTLNKIAVQKAGIIGDCPAVVSACVPESVRNVFLSGGAEIAEPVKVTGAHSFEYEGKIYELSAEGARQHCNAACAIKVAEKLGICERAVFEGVKATKPEGRLQRFLRDGVTYILDGAHNAEAVAALAEFIGAKYADTENSLIFGCMSDKEPGETLGILKGLFFEVIAVSPQSPRAMPAEKIYRACRENFENVKKADGVSAALEASRGKTVVVSGSFALLKEAKEWIERK